MERYQEIQSALPLTSDSAITQASVLMAQTAVDQLRILHTSIDRFNENIQSSFRKHADHDLLWNWTVIDAGRQLFSRPWR